MRRIALLRGGGLGDLVFVLPAVQALRDTYPDAELVLLGTAVHAELLRDRPGPINRVLPLPTANGVYEAEPGGQPDAQQQTAFFDRIEPLDLAVQAHGGGRWSNPFVLRLGARVTVGTRTPDARPLDRWLPYRYHQHEALRWLEVVELVGATGSIGARMTVTEQDLAEARHALQGLPEPVVVVHPGATDPRRRWPMAGFAEVAARLADHGCGVAVVGSAEETDLVDQVLRHAGRRSIVGLAGRLSLSGLVGVLAQADVVLANDSGPRHLAEAVGTATVGMYWCGNMINAAPFWRGASRALIGWTVCCPVCGAALTDGGGGSTCGHQESWLTDIGPASVFEEVLSLLGPSSQRHETVREGR